jgi:hypothetical protein
MSAAKIPPSAPRVLRAARPEEYVQQRGGKKDCVIASVATAIVAPYEVIAAALEISLSSNGIPEVGKGIDVLDALGAFFKIGWSLCPLFSLEAIDGKETRPRHLTSDEIKEIVKGRQAIIGYSDADPEVGEHSLAWNGKNAIDCTNGTVVGLSDVTIRGAVVFSRLPVLTT